MARYPDKDENTVKVTTNKQSKVFKQQHFWSFFNIDPSQHKSYEAEENWIQQSLAEAVAWMRSAQKHPLFMNALKTVTSDKMYEAIIAGSYSPSVDNFFQRCHANMEKLDNLNPYVILDESKSIKLFLCNSESKTKKYQWQTEADCLGHDTGTSTPGKKKGKCNAKTTGLDDQNDEEPTEVIATVINNEEEEERGNDDEEDTDSDNE